MMDKMKQFTVNSIIIFFIGLMACTSLTVLAKEKSSPSKKVQKEFSLLEQQNGGRLGVYAINTANDQQIAFNADKRFPMACTAKLIAVAAVLKKSETEPSLLQKNIKYSKQDIGPSGWTPITSQLNNLENGMTVKQLCAAAIMHSDNLAMNLVMKQIGGPKAVDRYARTIGNKSFDLDSWFPQDAEVTPGSKSNTAAPRSMVISLKKLVLGDALKPTTRQLLKNWHS